MLVSFPSRSVKHDTDRGVADAAVATAAAMNVTEPVCTGIGGGMCPCILTFLPWLRFPRYVLSLLGRQVEDC